MAKKLFTIGAINISMEPPHSPERYRDLFLSLDKLDPSPIGPYHGDTHLVLASASIEKSTQYVYGKFVKFTQIDPSKPWFSKQKRTPVLDENGRPKPLVSSDYGPNYEEIPFVFIPEGHYLYFDTLSKGISPKALSRGLFSILNNIETFLLFGNIYTTVAPAHDAIDRILAIPFKHKIEVVWTRPNPDVVTDDEQEMLARFDKIGVGRVNQTYIGKAREAVEPDKQLLTLMGIAARNGYNKVTGRDESDKPVQLSTKDYPNLASTKYSERDGYWNTFLKLAQKFHSTLVRK